MTEQSSRPAADAADQSPFRDLALDQTGSVASAPDATVSAEADVTSETPVEHAIEPSADQMPAGLEQTDSEPTDSEQKTDKPAKKRVPPQEVIARLVAAWPSAFFAEPRSVKPLTIGVLQQILANRPAELDGLNSHAIRTGIKFYTSRLSYHYGMVHNTHRITLAGEPAEEVDDKAREFAKAQIVAIKQQREARQKASQEENKAAQNPADAASGEQSTDESTEGKKPPRAKQARKPRPATGSEGKGRDADAGASSGQRPRRPRRDQARPPRSDKPVAPGTQAAAPATENLSMEEKLARLAQHFGKPG
ncbi:ProQ/FinO family protein [Halothiobacillus sp.]|uniref:ProQ/FinO family protein n=1 Tax=Halothiobacillus sp. TaxID=1891311 RepID=UPI0026351342|nr:ProQ/FinO family protein [Halothiobacillus sp.]